MHSPRQTHLQAVKRIFRYLVGTIQHDLLLYRHSRTELHAYADADWAGCPDTRCSTSGFCIFLSNNLLSWRAKKKVNVARSSIEVEYRSMMDCVAGITWLQKLLGELGVRLSQLPIM